MSHPSMGDLVLKALDEQRQKKAYASGSSSAGVPEAVAVPKPFGSIAGDVTPPTRTDEPGEMSSPSSAQSRPRHRSQASFDWFASGDSASRSVRNRASLPSASHDGHTSNEDDGGLRGAFTDDDLVRGSRIVRQMSAQDGGTHWTQDKARASSVKRPSSVSGALARKGTDNAHGKDGTEWEDELRDSFNTGAAPPKPKLDRRLSLWNTARRESKAAKGGSGTSTPDESGDGATPKRPKAPRRATTAGWAAIRNRIKHKDPKAKDPNKSLTGHELITVRSCALSVDARRC